MKNILVLNSSIRKNESISRSLTEILINELKDNESSIIERDLSSELPLISEELLESVNKTPEERNSEETKLASPADKLIEELQWADVIVIGLPMYNFGPPASIKAWADLVARAGTTFSYTETGPVGLLKETRSFIIAVSGGTQIHSGIDYMTPWLEHFLNFIGIEVISTIVADGIYSDDGYAKIENAKESIKKTLRVN